MPRTPKQICFDYQTLANLTGKSLNAIRKDYSRGLWSERNLESVVLYVARHTFPDVKDKISLSMHERELVTVNNKKHDQFKQQRKAYLDRIKEQRNGNSTPLEQDDQ